MGRYKRISAGSDSAHNTAMLQTLVNASTLQAPERGWRLALQQEAGMPKLAPRPYAFACLGQAFSMTEWRDVLDIVAQPRRGPAHKPYYLAETEQGIVVAMPSYMLQDAYALAQQCGVAVNQTGMVR